MSKTKKVKDLQDRLNAPPKKPTSRTWPTEEIIALAVAVDRVHGFTSSSSYIVGGNNETIPTNKEILGYIACPWTAPNWFVHRVEVTDEDRILAQEIIKHYRKLSFGVIADNLGEYKSRIFAITQNPSVKFADFGFVASIPGVFYKDLERKYLDQKIKNTVQEYLGAVAEPIELHVEYIRIKYLEKITCYSHLAVTSTGHLVEFLNGKKLSDVNSKQVIRAKVKAHTTHYQTNSKLTQLNYVKPVDTVLEWQ
jgi:hypothetical protein